MAPNTTDLDELVSRTHTGNCRAKVISDGALVALLPLIGGEATIDRTAAQRTSFDLEIPGAALAPNSLDDLLAPGKTKIQVEAGVRQNAVDTRTVVNGRGHGWAVSDRSTGVMNGLIDAGGLLALGYIASVTVAQAVEDDTAQAITSLQVVPVAQAAETDTAGGFTSAVVVAPAAETDGAPQIVPAVAFTQAAEADTAGAFTSAVEVTPAVELDSAQPVAFTQFVLVDLAVETDSAGAVTSAVVVAQAVEDDTAQAITVGNQTLYPSTSLFPSPSRYPTAP